MLVAIGDRLARIDIIIILFIVLNINPYIPISPFTISPKMMHINFPPYMQMKHQTRVYFMFSKMRRTVYILHVSVSVCFALSKYLL